jgi:hypothetical protein
LHTLSVRQHEPRLALLARLGQRLALLVAGLELAVFVVHLTHAAPAVADTEQHCTVGGEHFPIIPIRRSSPGIGLGHHRTDLATQCVLRQADGVLAVLELLYGAQDVAVDAVTGEVVLGDAEQRDAGLSQQVAIVLGFGHVAA